MGRPQWRGQTSLLKAMFFLLLGSPDTHTRLRNTYVINQIGRLELPSDCRVLEGGFGRAATLFWLSRRHPGWHLTGVELDPLMAGDAGRAVARGGYGNVEIVEGSIEDLDQERYYDLAISIDIMEHIEDDVGFLKRHYRALKPGGHLVLHVPKRHQEQWRLFPAFRRHSVEDFVRDKRVGEDVRQVLVHGHVRDEYTAEELRQVAEAAGFEVLDLRETIGRWGEISFELNHALWRCPTWLRYLFSVLTYPLAVPIGYLDILAKPSRGNSLLLTAVRE
jgi:SAM-dependent methyltransferase